MTETFAPPTGPEMSRGTPQSLALGVEFVAGPGGDVMRVPFRDDLVGDPALGGLSDGVIVTLLDQACGFAIGAALRERAELEGRDLRMGAMATLDFRIDYVRPAKAGLSVTGRAECLRINGEVAFVRGVAFETDPDDPVAIAQAAFMISSALAVA
ncbi:MAG TPA: PaaI family thioesterase [Caulobacteraceae bacterium]|nr:PaaI family thioesterase [Caulobacteraceae bacterium]